MKNRKDLAKVILDLSYTEMVLLGNSLVEIERTTGKSFDSLEPFSWCNRLSDWAEQTIVSSKENKQ